jgi:hypothetical protein
MKRQIILGTFVIVFCALFFGADTASTATLPPILWTDTDRVVVSVVDLGILGTVEWELVALSNHSVTMPIGIGIRTYYPVRGEFGHCFFSDSTWLMHGYFGEWTGSGSMGYASSTWTHWEASFFTSPPPFRLNNNSFDLK